jgi:hypothetical protein
VCLSSELKCHLFISGSIWANRDGAPFVATAYPG